MLEGLSDVLLRLDAAVLAMEGPAAEATVAIVVDHAIASMLRSVPVDTGELMESIHDEDASGPGLVARRLIAGTDHAIYPEYGTSKMKAQPYFRPPLHVAEAELPKVAREMFPRIVPGMTR